jgi:glycosyltransferase involved in cell wall biosynthesis
MTLSTTNIKKSLIFLAADNPSPIIYRKIEYLQKRMNIDITLLIWNRKKSLTSIPFESTNTSYRVHFFSLPAPRNSPSRLYIMGRFLLKIISYCRHHSCDGIQAINMDMLLLAFLAQRFANIPLLILDLLDSREIILKPIIRKCYARILNGVDWIFVTSPKFWSDYLLKINPVLRDRKHTFIPNAPVLSSVQYYKFKKRKELTVGYFGYLRGNESLRRLIDIVQSLNESGTQIKLLFAGIGIEKAFIENKAKEYSYIEYYGSYNYTTEIGKLYARIDLVYSIYDFDYNKKLALGCRFCEAFLYRKPIIVQDQTYMGELIKQYDAGFIIKNGNWRQLKELLKNVANDRSLLERIKKNLDQYQAKYAFESYTENLKNSYQKIFQLGN